MSERFISVSDAHGNSLSCMAVGSGIGEMGRISLKNILNEFEARIAELEKAPKGGISYVCAECHAFANTPEYSLDCGTTLKCSKCGKATIVNLQTQDEYAKTVNMLADGW